MSNLLFARSAIMSGVVCAHKWICKEPSCNEGKTLECGRMTHNSTNNQNPTQLLSLVNKSPNMPRAMKEPFELTLVWSKPVQGFRSSWNKRLESFRQQLNHKLLVHQPIMQVKKRLQNQLARCPRTLYVDSLKTKTLMPRTSLKYKSF